MQLSKICMSLVSLGSYLSIILFKHFIHLGICYILIFEQFMRIDINKLSS